MSSRPPASPHPLSPELRDASGGEGVGADAAARPLRSLQDRDCCPGLGQLEGGGEAGEARSHHDDAEASGEAAVVAAEGPRVALGEACVLHRPNVQAWVLRLMRRGWWKQRGRSVHSVRGRYDDSRAVLASHSRCYDSITNETRKARERASSIGETELSNSERLTSNLGVSTKICLQYARFETLRPDHGTTCAGRRSEGCSVPCVGSPQGGGKHARRAGCEFYWRYWCL